MESAKISSIVRVASIFLAAFLLFGCTGAEPSVELAPDLTDVSSNETININTANKDELQRIPHIGERLAEGIIEHREKHGLFRRTEHLMLLNGISDSRFREIRHLVRVD